MKLDNDKIKEIEKRIEAAASEFDPGCEIKSFIYTALHTETLNAVSSRLKIEIDFTNIEGF